jgi:hypothetical protein
VSSPTLLKTDKHHSRKTTFTGLVSRHHYVGVAGAKTIANFVNASRSFSPSVQLRLLNITLEPGVFVEWENDIGNPEYFLALLHSHGHE